MYENFNSNKPYRAPSASEINSRVREQEKQLSLMNARLHNGSSEENVKKTSRIVAMSFCEPRSW